MEINKQIKNISNEINEPYGEHYGKQFDIASNEICSTLHENTSDSAIKENTLLKQSIG